MGAKTGLLAFADKDIPTALRTQSASNVGAAADFVRRVHPGYSVEYAEAGNLGDDVYPLDDMTYATRLDGVDLVCDRRFTESYLSHLPPHLAELSAGRRRTVLHTMHSTSDYVSCAVWHDGSLVRALALSPLKGVIENIGDPFDFEQPYVSLP